MKYTFFDSNKTIFRLPGSTGRFLLGRSRGMKRGQGGYTLIETLAGLAILAMVGVTFLSAMVVSTKATIIADERTTAESLSQAQLEYVMQCHYDDMNVPPLYGVDGSIDIPQGYSIEVNAERLDLYEDGTANDDGVQRITVKIYHEGELVTTTEGYKARYE